MVFFNFSMNVVVKLKFSMNVADNQLILNKYLSWKCCSEFYNNNFTESQQLDQLQHLNTVLAPSEPVSSLVTRGFVEIHMYV